MTDIKLSDERIAGIIEAASRGGNPPILNATILSLCFDLQDVRAQHAALLGVVRDAVEAMRGYDIDLPYPLLSGLDPELPTVENWAQYAKDAHRALRALADAAAAEPRDGEGG